MDFMHNEDLGKFILRMVISGLLIFHGLHFLTGETNQLTNLGVLGIPEFIGYPGAVALEIVAPILAMLGIFTRVAGAGMAVFMILAIGLRHLNDHLYTLGAGGDAYFLERQFMYLWGSVAIMFLGSGKLGLNIGGRWN